jgi:multisubunit Na+/H+ antiporter MnhB subunit
LWRALAVPGLIAAILTPVLLLTGPLLWIAAIALVLLLLGMIERRVKPKPQDRGPRASSIVPLVVVVLIVAACWGASLGVWMMWVLHTE